MRYVTELNTNQQETLTEMWHNHPQHRARNRAHMLLLSQQRFDRQAIGRICGVDPDTVSDAFRNWERVGIVGLLDKPKSGRPRILNKDETNRAVELVKLTPNNPKEAHAQLEKELGRTIHPKAFRRALRRAGLMWKRMRLSVKYRREQAAFVQAQQKLAQLHAQEERGELDVVYFDESGFSMTPSVPYGWQPVGETVALPATNRQRLNILGFCTRFNELSYQIAQGRLDAAQLTEVFDRYVATLRRATVVVLDNHPVHRSRAFRANIAKWQAAGLTLYYLPPYSPELNLIEIVWRVIKHQWLPLAAYTDWQTFQDELTSILNHIGLDDEYAVSFV